MFNDLYPQDLKNGISTPPGRVQSYIEQYRSGINRGLLPQSCLLTVHSDLYETMYYSSQDLRSGAGVKLVLDNFKAAEPLSFEWGFFLDPDHPDFKNITEYQRKFYINNVSNVNVIYVNDSMEETEGLFVSIEKSWELFIKLAQQGSKIVVDLSRLRPAGTVNRVGLTATGAVGDGSELSNESSFLAIYIALAEHLRKGNIMSFLQLMGTLNSTLRRGGQYKNGIITSSMTYTNPAIWDYLNADITQIPGSHKKGIRLDAGILENKALVKLVCEKANNESLFLEKIDNSNPDLFLNVCIGLAIQNRGTCLLWRVNLGKCATLQDIVRGYADTAEYLTHLHISWRKDNPDKAHLYRPLNEDRQIAVDVMGLANFLAAQGVTFAEFNDALEYFLHPGRMHTHPVSEKAYGIVDSIYGGMVQAVEVSDKIMEENGLKPLDRIFTVEPAQSHSFQSKDLVGKTICRGIWAPFDRKLRRDSETQGSKIYNHGNVEIAVEVGAELKDRIDDNWQLLMNLTGRAHAISSDSWCETTPEWFEDFILRSPRKSRYYQEFRNYNQREYLAKTARVATDEEKLQCSIQNPGECSVCAE